jgi:hypothetical protein
VRLAGLVVGRNVTHRGTVMFCDVGGAAKQQRQHHGKTCGPPDGEHDYSHTKTHDLVFLCAVPQPVAVRSLFPWQLGLNTANNR